MLLSVAGLHTLILFEVAIVAAAPFEKVSVQRLLIAKCMLTFGWWDCMAALYKVVVCTFQCCSSCRRRSCRAPE